VSLLGIYGVFSIELEALPATRSHEVISNTHRKRISEGVLKRY